MKAIRFHSYGETRVLVLDDAPLPEIAADEVLVRVHAAAVNPADCKFRAGWFKDWVPLALPFIPGADLAGTVIAAGPLASRFEPGAKVFAMKAVPVGGSYAEYVAVRGDELARAPSSLPLEQAAGVPLAALTAWSALFEVARLRPDQTVLIHAAAGGVGSFAVQLARLAGARIIATASQANAERVLALGAERVIDHRQEDFAAAVKNVDLVLDAIGGESQARSFGVLRQGGTLVTLQPPGIAPDVAEAHGVRGVLATVSPHAARLAELAALIDAGRLTVAIDSEFPLADAAAAHQRSETGRARGKVILRVA